MAGERESEILKNRVRQGTEAGGGQERHKRERKGRATE